MLRSLMACGQIIASSKLPSEVQLVMSRDSFGGNHALWSGLRFDLDVIPLIIPGRATRQYADIWYAIEAAASKQSPQPLPRSCRGRAQTLTPKKVVGYALAPLKVPRAGELAPQYIGMSLQYARPLVPTSPTTSGIPAFCQVNQAGG